LHSRGNASGYPQLALRNGTAHVVWTDLIDGAPQLRGAIYDAAVAAPAAASTAASTATN
jgi:hypothetical protein